MWQEIIDWISQNRVGLMWSAGVAVVAMIAGMIAAPIVTVKLPDDYFARSKAKRKRPWTPRRIAKNVVGGLLMAAGAAMLVVPGPGIMVLLLGVALTDFPGKMRFERWLITRGSVLEKANRLRAKYGKPPLEVNGEETSGVARAGRS